MARKIPLEVIAGQEAKLIQRHIGDSEFTQYELDLLRHYERKRQTVYQKLKRVLEAKYGESQ